MTRFLQVFSRVLEQITHGAIFGALFGLLGGGSEYLLLRQQLSAELTTAYWDIVLPYVVVGILGGILIAAGVGLLPPRPGSAGVRLARLLASLTALVVLAYLVVWATYQLGKPVLKLSNVLAYLGATLAATGAGVGAYRLSARLLGRVERVSGATRLVRLWTPLTLGVATAAFLSWPLLYSAKAHSSPPPVPRPSTAVAETRPDIVFILIDALRADHLPVYGYSRQTAPNLTALARGGMTFTRMYAQAASTRPSVATIFSSLYPATHKANETRAYLSDAVTRLPELLRAAGYQTFAISANANVSPTFGYSKGFDEFEVWKTESAFRVTMMGRLAEDGLPSWLLGGLLGERAEIVPTADAITDRTLQWVSARASRPAPTPFGGILTRQPLFLYVHYIDPHDPYRPPPPYDRAFDYKTDPPVRAGGVNPLQLVSSERDPNRIGRLLDRYDGEILFADHHAGRLLKGLEALGVLDRSLVIVTADHGEEFFEHGKDTHGKSAYEEVLRVPLIMHWRDRIPAGGTSDGFVGHVDLMPTILTLVGIDPPHDIQGMSFAAQLRAPGDRQPDRLLFAQVIQDGFALEMVRDARYKLIRHTHGPRKGHEEFYDLVRGPLERTNLIEGAPVEAAALQKQLDVFNRFAHTAASRIPSERVQRVDRDTERALRSLGYIK